MRLGVDVDLTVVDTGRAWYKFLSTVSELSVPSFDEYMQIVKEVPYDLTKVFFDLDMNKCLDYWREEYLYDTLMPLPNVVDVLEDLKVNKRYEIVFVSTIKGNHHKSKYYFLKKHFPFMDGFIATKEKKYANVHMMVDDRLNVLEKMDRSVITVLKQTPYDQSTNFKPSHAFNDWLDFSKLVYKDY